MKIYLYIFYERNPFYIPLVRHRYGFLKLRTSKTMIIQCFCAIWECFEVNAEAISVANRKLAIRKLELGAKARLKI